MATSLEGKTVIVLLPTYNDWMSVAHLIPRIDEALAPLKVRVRIVVVDDGSYDLEGKDALESISPSVIERIDEVVLTRNQGNQRTLAIGVAYVAAREKGDYLVVMDSDNEDNPDYIPKLLQTCAGSGDRKIVFAERSKRSEGLAFRLYYQIYRGLYRMLTSTSISMGNFSVIPWKLVLRLANVAELWNHFPASIIRSRMPFQMIACARGTRLFGETRMNLVALVTHAFSAFSIFSDVVAVRTIIFALLISGLIACGALTVVGLRLFTNIPLIGWTSTILGLMVIALIQILSAAVLMLFLTLFMRMQPALIPAQEFEKFILSVATLYSRGRENPSAQA